MLSKVQAEPNIDRQNIDTIKQVTCKLLVIRAKTEHNRDLGAVEGVDDVHSRETCHPSRH